MLSPDLLWAFDVDFDFAAGKVSLFSQEHCPGQVVYWTHDPHAEIPFTMDTFNRIKIDVQLDGKDAIAFLNTNAVTSTITQEAAKGFFGIDETAVLRNNGTYQFKTLTMQGVTVNNPILRLISGGTFKSEARPVLQLGMGVLRQLHFYIAYKEKNLYVTPATAH
jgi:hypothetical protein